MAALGVVAKETEMKHHSLSDLVAECSHLDVKMAYYCSRCPLPGCLQKSIRATDLEEHHELKLQLDQALKASGTDRIQ